MVDLAPGLRSHKVQLSQVRMHYVEAGAADAPLLLLLHGWPQTWLAWSQVIPHLPRVIGWWRRTCEGWETATRPTTGYDAQTLASDILELVDALGASSFGVAGHDNGAIIAMPWRRWTATG